ncbi:MAG: RNA polymerase sigma factor [Planctomycetes bacterium]|nr:RNA polymerase sigma factor [Planctomycetota bacterium]
MALTAIDRSILQHCLQHEAGSWNDFVDRFLGLIYHVIHYTAHLRSFPVTPELVEDIAQEILSRIVANDYGLLRSFRGRSSLATYLTVLSRRICVQELTKRGNTTRKPLPAAFQSRPAGKKNDDDTDEEEEVPKARVGMETLDLLQKLIRKLPNREREVVRLFYFEGRTYEEISIELNLPVKTIGPILKRARQMLRQHEDEKG